MCKNVLPYIFITGTFSMILLKTIAAPFSSSYMWVPESAGKVHAEMSFFCRHIVVTNIQACHDLFFSIINR